MRYLTPSALAALFTLAALSLIHDAQASSNPSPKPDFPSGAPFTQDLPPLPAGMQAMRVPDPVRDNASAGSTSGFACFGACGPSCACIGRVDGNTQTEFDGKSCTWSTITCRTHAFCAWHDTCYNRCDYQYPGHVGDGSFRRALCYRGCDISCSTGADPQPWGGWDPASLDPGAPPMTPGIQACLSGLADPEDVPYEGVITFAELIGCFAPAP